MAALGGLSQALFDGSDLALMVGSLGASAVPVCGSARHSRSPAQLP
jgi:hypothetical protein